jgi:hypothetical protein
MTNYVSFYADKKYHQLIKIVNFYDKQIEVLKEMLKEIEWRYGGSTTKIDRFFYEKAFEEKHNKINVLKHKLNVNKYLLTEAELNSSEDSETLIHQNKEIENLVNDFEKEVNELSKDFKLYVINKI